MIGLVFYYHQISSHEKVKSYKKFSVDSAVTPPINKRKSKMMSLPPEVLWFSNISFNYPNFNQSRPLTISQQIGYQSASLLLLTLFFPPGIPAFSLTY